MMNIIKNSKVFFSFSSILVIVAILSVLFNLFKNGELFNYAIDFSGGTILEIQVNNEDVSKNDVFSAVDSFAESHSLNIQSADNNRFVFKMKHLDEEGHRLIIDKLDEKFSFTENRFVTMGPSVGETMKKKALIALVIALVCIVLYIAYAFREIPNDLSVWKFGFAAIAALMHDVIIAVGVFSILGLIIGVEIDSLFITGLLTVMGFSVHDTIVVFDRFRENLKHSSSFEDMDKIGNDSIMQTMARSINTSISTLFPLVALFFFSASDIRMFILVLIIGIVVGTYSSVFIATPLLVFWQKKNVD